MGKELSLEKSSFKKKPTLSSFENDLYKTKENVIFELNKDTLVDIGLEDAESHIKIYEHTSKLLNLTPQEILENIKIIGRATDDSIGGFTEDIFKDYFEIYTQNGYDIIYLSDLGWILNGCKFDGSLDNIVKDDNCNFYMGEIPLNRLLSLKIYTIEKNNLLTIMI